MKLITSFSPLSKMKSLIEIRRLHGKNDFVEVKNLARDLDTDLKVIFLDHQNYLRSSNIIATLQRF